MYERLTQLLEPKDADVVIAVPQLDLHIAPEAPAETAR